MNIVNIKRALPAIVAVCLSAASLSAQSSHSRPRAKPAMWTALQLTETQKAQVKAIHAKHTPAIKVAQKQPDGGAAAAFQREMTDVRNILTSSQQQTFDSFMNAKQRVKRGSVARVMPAKIAVPR